MQQTQKRKKLSPPGYRYFAVNFFETRKHALVSW